MAMNDEEQALSTLGQPLVSPNAPVVTQDAVQKLTDAFHQGYITINDILEHTGAVAAARGQSALEALKISPDIVQAQKAKANLETAQAQAQIGLTPGTAALAQAQTASALSQIPGSTELGKTKTAQETATLNYGPSLAKYLQYGNVPIYTKDEDGNPVRNYQAEATIGNRYTHYENLAQWAQMGLTPVKPEGEDIVLQNGQRVKYWKNKFDENITPSTPSNPNPIYDEYQQHRRDALNFLFRNHDDVPNTPANLVVPNATNAAEGVPPTVEPTPAALPPPLPSAATDPNAARAWLSDAGTMSGSSAAKLSDPDALAIYASYQQHLAAQPVIQPSAAPVTVDTPGHTVTVTAKQPLPAVNMPVIAPAGVPVAQSLGFPGVAMGQPDYSPLTKQVRESEPYKNWAEKLPTIKKFQQVAASYTNAPDEITNQKDLDLARSAVMLATSGSGGSRGPVEERVPNIEAAQPLLEQLYGLKKTVLKQHRFDTGTRDRLINSVNQTVQSLEDPARNMVKLGVAQAQRTGVNPAEAFSSDELGLAQGSAAAPAAAAGAPIPVTVGGVNYKVWPPTH
jgi:hypothetical protein